MLEQLRLEDFSGKIGEKFQLRLDSGETAEIELIEAAGTGGNPLKRPPFSIVFRVPEDAIHEQKIYRLEHAELGEMDLFLVPLGPGETGMRWEAVFT
jgi:hypothetical protein